MKTYLLATALLLLAAPAMAETVAVTAPTGWTYYATTDGQVWLESNGLDGLQTDVTWIDDGNGIRDDADAYILEDSRQL